MHDNQTPKLPTIENLDNIEDHYYQIDQDINVTFSDEEPSDPEEDDEFFEPIIDPTFQPPPSIEDDKTQVIIRRLG